MKVETATGAALAALISFLSALNALFMNDATLTFGDITTSAWVGMVTGAAINFAKDFKAIDSRRAIAKLKGTTYDPN